MVNINWDALRGATISVLFTGRNNIKEAYTGMVEEVGEDHIILKFFDSAHTIDRIIVKKDVVESIWIYKEGVKGGA